MAIEKHATGENGSYWWGETANINYFLDPDSALTPVTVGGAEVRTKSVPIRKVRRYVGDPQPYTVPSNGNVRYLFDPGRKNGGGTPGKEMILDDGTEKRAFTYEGAWLDMHAFLLGNLAAKTTCFSEGATYEITPL